MCNVPVTRLNRATCREDALKGRICIQRCHAGSPITRDFVTYETVEELACSMGKDHVSIVMGAMGMNELIIGDMPQKLKVDVDIDRCIIDEQVVTPFHLMRLLGAALEEATMMVFATRLPMESWRLYESHGSEKLSYHLVSTQHCVESAQVARYLAVVLANQGKVLNEIVDTGVYKSLQFFRVASTSKVTGEPRHKTHREGRWWYDRLALRFNRAVAPDVPITLRALRESLVGQVTDLETLSPATSLPASVKDPERGNTPSHLGSEISGNLKSLLTAVSNLVRSPQCSSMGEFAVSCSGPCRLTRKTPGLCPIHDREHTSDNLLAQLKRVGECADPADVRKRVQLHRVDLHCFRGMKDGTFTVGHVKLCGEQWKTTSHAQSTNAQIGNYCSPGREAETVSSAIVPSAKRVRPNPEQQTNLTSIFHLSRSSTLSKRHHKRKLGAFAFEGHQ